MQDDELDSLWSEKDDLRKFQRYCGHDGRIVSVDIGKRIGGKIILLTPNEIDPTDTPASKYSADHVGLLRDLYRNLTRIQRRTWHKLLLGRSIADIANEEGVRRAAIYCRIRSMANRNGFCKRWWRRRARTNQHE
jgi:hypothetical protein